MSPAELDAQDVRLLPERATLHRGGGGISIHQTAIATVVDLGGSGDTNVAVAAIVNL
ncbi:MAG TPA: hypothetical protein VEI83_10390 [Acidimicrobiales bacterium]|nr:hypothetical protein [Acidimicrobiales bacterium]